MAGQSVNLRVLPEFLKNLVEPRYLVFGLAHMVSQG
jgi:hypothetical protein